MGTAAHKPWSDCRVSERIYFRAAGFLIFLVFAAGRFTIGIKNRYPANTDYRGRFPDTGLALVVYRSAQMEQ